MRTEMPTAGSFLINSRSRWGCIPKHRFVGEDPANTATGFGHIAFEAGNQVHVDVAHGLASGKPFIDANVEAIGGSILL